MVSLEWRDNSLRFIDQTKLPQEEVYIETSDYRVVGEAIRRLQIRGAPAIGVAAAYAVVLAISNSPAGSVKELSDEMYTAINELAQTRPTAVNLFTALGRMRRVFEQSSRADVKTLRRHLLMEAKQIHEEDIEACRRIGEFGAAMLPNGVSILTHCNTGALATTGTGTAQSVITTAAKQGKVTRVFVDETRPLLQGARLTAWELLREGVDVTLITDSTAGFLMQKREVDVVIVGADRIAANGDTANKVGTYTLAVLAERHGIPFYVAAPTTTFDMQARSGRNIPIEERDPTDVTHINGMRIAAEGVKVFAPAFDLTPGELIRAIITERGVLKPPFTQSIAAMHKGERLQPEPSRDKWQHAS
jgi:methylthioribose-1-phosphate isomerase